MAFLISKNNGFFIRNRSIVRIYFDFCGQIRILIKMNLLTKWWRQLFEEQINEESDTMKYLIVGLGNMGAKYDNTRHNIGFDVIDALGKRFEVKFEHEKLGDLGEFKYKGRIFVLLKPSTFMNLSGKAVNYWLQKKKIQQENLLIVLDDLNLDFGRQRMKGKGGDGGHNGLKHINEVLGNTKYARLKIGIGSDFSKGRQVDFVLGKWTDEEAEGLIVQIKKSADAVLSFGTIGLSRTMNSFNS